MTGGTIAPYSTITPEAALFNNALNTSTDSVWVSFYIGNWYCDSKVIGPLGPGEGDTVSFSDWNALERNPLDVRCVGGGVMDEDLQNNICKTIVAVTLSDFEILEILSPRGVIAKNDTVTPGVLIRNNGSSGNTVSVTFTVDSYIDVQSIYLDPGTSDELFFNDWLTPSQTGVCSTSCFLTVSDDRPCNDILCGEVLIQYEVGIEEDTFDQRADNLFSPEPNPFSTSTTITFRLAESGIVRMDIYDIAGRLMKTIENGLVEAGEHAVIYDAAGLIDGIYLIRLTTETATFTERCVLIR